MMYKICRNIHPIGQGGFSSEHHRDDGSGEKLFVYDCGEFPGPSQRSREIAKNSLPNIDIDGLFISHFDEDHISLIPNLIERRKVKKLIIPFLGPISRNQIQVCFESEELANIFLSPERVFGNVEIIYINPFPPESIIEHETIIYDELKSKSINSGSSIEINASSRIWEYVPFNIRSEERQIQFNRLCEGVVDINRIGNIDYAYRVKNKLKKIYKIVRGGINHNSLIVYSGLKSSVDGASILTWNSNCNFCGYRHNATACLFTGDYDSRDIRLLITNLGEDRCQKIGTVQIPHHGAERNWNDRLIFSHAVSYFVQCGEKNKFGHPHASVLNSIRMVRPCHISKVTESASTEYSQIIQCS